jgi:hypothetical protein
VNKGGRLPLTIEFLISPRVYSEIDKLLMHPELSIDGARDSFKEGKEQFSLQVIY